MSTCCITLCIMCVLSNTNNEQYRKQRAINMENIPCGGCIVNRSLYSIRFTTVKYRLRRRFAGFCWRYTNSQSESVLLSTHQPEIRKKNALPWNRVAAAFISLAIRRSSNTWASNDCEQTDEQKNRMKQIVAQQRRARGQYTKQNEKRAPVAASCYPRRASTKIETLSKLLCMI